MSHVKTYKRGSKTIYRGIKYRSRWEVYTAKLLLYGDIYFLYEPRRFYFSKFLSYLPDFYIPSYGTYLEVKGSLSKKDRIVLTLFSQTHRLKYLGKEEFSRISGRGTSFMSLPNVVDYVPKYHEVERFKEFLSS